MKKYLISLAKDEQRRALFFAQPDTADFILFNAINTMNEDQNRLAALFDTEKFARYYGRAVTKGEIGCTLSHLQLYTEIAADTSLDAADYVLICEDDALFAANFQHHLDSLLAQAPNADIILLGQSKIPDFNHRMLEINYPTTFKPLRTKIGDSGYGYAYPYRNYFAGTVAYVIRKSAAEKFLSPLKGGERPFWLADDYILFERDFGINSLVVRPLLVIENPSLSSNLESLRGSLQQNLLMQLFKYPLKKLLAIKRNLL
ncbi:glycosyltransferase family 25 protein [Mesocricetibacter intestinalis]|uniref:glycosyltransferase family 25 protein n=1 Tax=Mesocricetibacter intestinalis TaxID=1521930 RepID=UPI00105FF404|nr:glycosyltransferase family 25 protein [Mesocricetibacter intestinalis]